MTMLHQLSIFRPFELDHPTARQSVLDPQLSCKRLRKAKSFSARVRHLTDTLALALSERSLQILEDTLSIKSNDDLPSSDMPASPTMYKMGDYSSTQTTHDPAKMTPPLTPSSSIRTTTSFDSTFTTSTNSAEGEDPVCDGRLLVGNEMGSSRFLLIEGLPPNASPALLKHTFSSALNSSRPEEMQVPTETHMGHQYIQGVNISPRLQGLVVLAFWDLRDAARARTACLRGEINIPGARLGCRYIAVEDLRAMIGYSNVGTTGRLRVEVELRAEPGDELPTNAFIDIAKLRGVLGGFGGLRSFEEIYGYPHSTFLIEYYDVRDRDTVLHELHGQVRLGMYFGIFSVDDVIPEPVLPPVDVKPPTAITPTPYYPQMVPQLSLIIPTSPMMPNGGYYSPALPSSQSPQLFYPFAYPHLPPPMAYHPFEYPITASLPPPPDMHPPTLAPVASITGDMEKMRVDSQPPSCLNYRTTRPPPNPTIRGNLSSREASHKASNNNEHTVIKNEVSLDKIKSGQDTRTTVMIKNIPNKMTSKELVKFIGDVCPLAIDFLYLRIDFANGCNVGYAFVNFIRIADLVKFTETKLGEKWNMFSSEKVLQMCYATYQGKEALVEKFKNSCIMDEREEWKPMIFYSEGPNIGLSEPFPAPTHLRRKERSSFNRGALYAPNMYAPGASGPHRRLKEWPSSTPRRTSPPSKKALH